MDDNNANLPPPPPPSIASPPPPAPIITDDDLTNALRAAAARGRVRHRMSRPPPQDLEEVARKAQDVIVQDTDGDASASRQSTVRRGLLDDPYAFAMTVTQALPRLPIINRGTYVRTSAIDKLVETFIKSNVDQNVQIVSLGAGTDTRFFRLRDKRLHFHVLYHEIDFPELSARKLGAIRAHARLSSTNTPFWPLRASDIDPRKESWGYYANEHPITNVKEGYLFHPIDLRNMPDKIPGLRDDVPTLIISECCLCYLEKEAADNVMQWFTSRIFSVGIIIYEPTNIGDSFGQMMLSNFAARKLSMPSVQAYSTPEAEMVRLKDMGFEVAQDYGAIAWLWENWVSPEEKDRIAKIEMLDEVEEWEMLGRHYIIAWAWRDSYKPFPTFPAWRKKCRGQCVRTDVYVPRPAPRNVWDSLGFDD